MIQSTKKLIEYLKNDKDNRESSIVHSYVNSILKLGEKNDASHLLDIFLKSPRDFDHSYLLPLFFKFGDYSFAERIAKEVLVDGKLNENADPILLNLLGNLKYEPVKEILFNYAFSNIESDYHLQTQSILGLLNFECAEYLDIIKTNIENCLNKNLFPEFVPALVCKLSDRTEILEQLYITGDSIASTDCNAGIILGFSLCGDDGKKHFKKALFNPNWETYSSSTGTVGYTYDGLNNLKISFSELYEEIKNLRDEKEISYSLDVFFSLLDIRIRDYEIQSNETFNDLYLNLFSWETSNNSNNLINLARIVELENRAHEYKRKIELKMTEEIIIQNYSS